MGALKSARPRLPEAFDTPARAELALAIAARKALDEKISGFGAAENAYWSHLAAAQEAVEAATSALEQAKRDATDAMIASAVGDPQKPGALTVREARAALQDAEDHLAVIRGTQDAITRQRNEATEAVQAAHKRVAQAARLVIREHPDLQAIASKTDAMIRDLARQFGLLNWAMDSHIFQDINHAGYVQEKTSDEKAAQVSADRFKTPPMYWNDLRGIMNEFPPAWHMAFEALQRDANAPLPDAQQ
jgi:predicted HAD superfamily Cof-like phosphohydrolase